MCRGWKKGEWQAVPNNIARKFHSSQLCWTRQENEWSIGCCKSFHIPHLFHICRQFNCYNIWNVQNKYATYTYEYKCGRPFTATLFQLLSICAEGDIQKLPPVAAATWLKPVAAATGQNMQITIRSRSSHATSHLIAMKPRISVAVPFFSTPRRDNWPPPSS